MPTRARDEHHPRTDVYDKEGDQKPKESLSLSATTDCTPSERTARGRILSTWFVAFASV